MIENGQPASGAKPEDSGWKLILPDLSTVRLVESTIEHDGREIAKFESLERTASLAISSVGTPFEDSNPMPEYQVVGIKQLEDRPGISREAIWITTYVLFTIRKEQEMIPIILQEVDNKADIIEYILTSGLGRWHPKKTEDIFLSRETFWQGAGTSVHNLGWLREYRDVVAGFPFVKDFTRTATVIASHPLRPPKSPGGACIYRRYCPDLGQCYEIQYIDVNNQDHLNAFHRWHNSERVNAAWGEAGSMESHIEYIKRQMNDPHCWPVIGRWDGDLMGYFELTWVKEDHVAQHIPGGADEYDRGIHIVVGEEKYRGKIRARGWFNSSVHYMFLAEPRTKRVLLEPKSTNAAVIAVATMSEFHKEVEFDFPYKRSTLLLNTRERFFRRAVLP